LIKLRYFNRRGTYSRKSACHGYIWPMLKVAGSALFHWTP
jgi:hypothetical protein